MKHEKDYPLISTPVLKAKEEIEESGLLDYRSEALPTWCPGCGYFAIAHGLYNALARLHIPHKDLVFVSGIGCSGRFPFFMRGYGFHSIHGRAIPVASGVKMANPELTVIAIGGDGDGLAIGGGHLPHAIRRNIDITYLLVDNAIYGLTKGQGSPTTPIKQVTPTHPYGNPDSPINPTLLAIVYGAGFVARGWAGDPKSLEDILLLGLNHKGFSFIHVVSPCVTFDHTNITYERLRNQWHPIPSDHDPKDQYSAIKLALSDIYYYGVFKNIVYPDWQEKIAGISYKIEEDIEDVI